MFIRLRPEGSTTDIVINLDQVVKAEYEKTNGKTANVRLWYSNGERETWTGEEGGEIVQRLRQNITF